LTAELLFSQNLLSEFALYFDTLYPLFEVRLAPAPPF
jgi:hypothetical protein